MKEISITTKRLNKTYKSGGEDYKVIKALNIEIYKEDFTIIMGSSGSGKSTLLYMLCGLDDLTSGEIKYTNQRVDKFSEKEWSLFRRKKIGFVYQGINLVPNLSIIENVATPGYLIDRNVKRVDTNALNLLEEMDISNLANRLPSQTSGGEQQRAAVARAMINSPEILFADEPTGSLNSSSGKQLLDILTSINKKGQTIVMVTHDLKASIRGNRILYLKDGEISGELNLGVYNENDSLDRETYVFNWLKEKGW